MEDKLKEIIKREIKNQVKIKYNDQFYVHINPILRDLLRVFGKKEDTLLNAIMEFHNEYKSDDRDDNSFINRLIDNNYNPIIITKYLKNNDLNIDNSTLLHLYYLTKDTDFLVNVIGDLSTMIKASIKNKKLVKDQFFLDTLSKSINELNPSSLMELLRTLNLGRGVSYASIPQPIIEMLKNHIEETMNYVEQTRVMLLNRNYSDLFDLVNEKKFKPVLISNIGMFIMVEDISDKLYGYVDKDGNIIIPTIFDEMGVVNGNGFRGQESNQVRYYTFGHIMKKREDMDVGYYKMDLENGELIDYTK